MKTQSKDPLSSLLTGPHRAQTGPLTATLGAATEPAYGLGLSQQLWSPSLLFPPCTPTPDAAAWEEQLFSSLLYQLAFAS